MLCHPSTWRSHLRDSLPVLLGGIWSTNTLSLLFQSEQNLLAAFLGFIFPHFSGSVRTGINPHTSFALFSPLWPPVGTQTQPSTSVTPLNLSLC